MMTRPWSNSALGDDATGPLATFQDSVPVQLIATRRTDFKTCHLDERLSAVVERNRVESFDFLPVVGPGAGDDGPIFGVLEVANHAASVTFEQIVRDVMQPLGETHLIGADASILTFIYDADRHPFRFVVAGREISGLVTLSDLQRLPVRAALFAMVTHLEIMMADVIRNQYPKQDQWIRLLSPKRQEGVSTKLQAAKSEDTFVDPLLYTQFCDKVAIIARGWRPSADGDVSKTRFHKDMDDAQELRDHLAHANNYADTRDRARQVCEIVRKMERWVRLMAEWSAKRTQAALILSEGV